MHLIESFNNYDASSTPESCTSEKREKMNANKLISVKNDVLRWND